MHAQPQELRIDIQTSAWCLNSVQQSKRDAWDKLGPTQHPRRASRSTTGPKLKILTRLKRQSPQTSCLAEEITSAFVASAIIRSRCLSLLTDVLIGNGSSVL